MGLAFGMFLASFDNPTMHEEPGKPQLTGRQQIILQAKKMGQKSWSSCKSFALMGFVFSLSECIVEKVRSLYLEFE